MSLLRGIEISLLGLLGEMLAGLGELLDICQNTQFYRSEQFNSNAQTNFTSDPLSS